MNRFVIFPLPSNVHFYFVIPVDLWNYFKYITILNTCKYYFDVPSSGGGILALINSGNKFTFYRGPCNGYFISRRSFSWGWLTEWWLMKTLEHNILEKYPNLNFNDIHKRWIYFRYLLTQGCLPQTMEHQSCILVIIEWIQSYQRLCNRPRYLLLLRLAPSNTL
jgi:hypothetical protein